MDPPFSEANPNEDTAAVRVDAAADLNRQSEARLEEIEQEVRAQQPLTSERAPLASLESEFQETANSSSFLPALQSLEKRYDFIRTVRGDGNCYYRAFLYALVEQMRTNQTEAQRILTWFQKDSMENLKKTGYDESMVDMFYESMVDLLQRSTDTNQQGGLSLDPVAFHQEMNQENGTSDYCTWYMRVVTAAQLKLDPDRFLPFIEQLSSASSSGQVVLDIQQFCQREVEPMGKECENIQVLALAEATQVQVQIEYLDGHSGQVTHHILGPSEAATKLYFLYRPGHYDILYPKSQ